MYNAHIQVCHFRVCLVLRFNVYFTMQNGLSDRKMLPIFSLFFSLSRFLVFSIVGYKYNTKAILREAKKNCYVDMLNVKVKSVCLD